MPSVRIRNSLAIFARTSQVESTIPQKNKNTCGPAKIETSTLFRSLLIFFFFFSHNVKSILPETEVVRHDLLHLRVGVMVAHTITEF